MTMPHRCSFRLGVALAALMFGATAPRAEAPAPPAPIVSGPAGLIGGHFRLHDPSGVIVDSDALLGKPYGLFFGFTHCPDICPTTLAQLSLALRDIPAPDLRIYFVTVDPERDTQTALGAYMQNFDPRIVALTGARPDVDEAIAGSGIVVQRTASLQGDDFYSHSAALMIVDDNGLIVDRLPLEIDVAELATRLAPLVRPRATAEAGR